HSSLISQLAKAVDFVVRRIHEGDHPPGLKPAPGAVIARSAGERSAGEKWSMASTIFRIGTSRYFTHDLYGRSGLKPRTSLLGSTSSPLASRRSVSNVTLRLPCSTSEM